MRKLLNQNLVDCHQLKKLGWTIPQILTSLLWVFHRETFHKADNKNLYFIFSIILKTLKITWAIFTENYPTGELRRQKSSPKFSINFEMKIWRLVRKQKVFQLLFRGIFFILYLKKYVDPTVPTHNSHTILASRKCDYYEWAQYFNPYYKIQKLFVYKILNPS